MHSTSYLLSAALLATAAMAGSRLGSAHGYEGRALMKRHFWCNGVDSETICPEGETMVPIDQYACNTIAAAGRTNQISPPVNGESSTTCPGAPAGDQGGQQSSSVASPPSPSTSTPPAPAPSSSDRVTGNIADNALEQPKQAAQVQSGSSMQMTCTNTDGGDVPASNGASFLLNCTINA